MENHNLFKEVQRVLLQDWDPIGIKNEPCAQDEYDSYVPVVCDMLRTKATIDEIADYLYLVEVRWMYPVKRTNHVDVKIRVYASVIARKLADISVHNES